MNWNREALEAWLEEASRKDEHAVIIDRYSQIDDSKIKARAAAWQLAHLVTCTITL